MIRTIAFLSLAAALSAPQASLAGAPTGYGTEGPGGARLDARAQSTFARAWNANNESKQRARESADWLRAHGKGFPLPF